MSRHLNALNALRLVLVASICILATVDLRRRAAGTEPRSLARVALAAWSGIAVAFTIFLWADHIRFPFLLDLMEGTILQHVAQAAHGLPVYPVATPDYVPLAYNPMYYYLSVPVTWVMGLDFPALRLVAIAGMAGSGAVIYAAVRDWTRSRWWGLIAVGLFATAYRVMDAYLDTAHADSWLLCAALLGSYVVGRASSRPGRLAGVVILVLGFWFKQHGALFALGGVLYLTYREGIRASLPYWITAGILGPLLYIAAVQWPFGAAFHYFTWDVPRGWSTLNAAAVGRVMYFAAHNYLPLVVAAVISLARVWRRNEPLRVWHVQFLCGALSAFMGALDYGSSDNVFIPFGAFVIVLGTVGIAEAVHASASARAYAAQAIAIALAFALLAYDPQSVIVSPHATAAYADLTHVLDGLDGPVYAPDLGELPGRPRFHPGAHWVALDDIGRGPGHTAADREFAISLMAPAAHPVGTAYLLTNIPLAGEEAPVSLLDQAYMLQTDFGERFAALAGLPKRYDHKFPRYLYRFAGASDTPAAP